MCAQFSDILLYATTVQPPSFTSYKVIKRIPLLGLRVREGEGEGRRGGGEGRIEGEGSSVLGGGECEGVHCLHGSGAASSQNLSILQSGSGHTLCSGVMLRHMSVS